MQPSPAVLSHGPILKEELFLTVSDSVINPREPASIDLSEQGPALTFRFINTALLTCNFFAM